MEKGKLFGKFRLSKAAVYTGESKNSYTGPGKIYTKKRPENTISSSGMFPESHSTPC